MSGKSLSLHSGHGVDPSTGVRKKTRMAWRERLTRIISGGQTGVDRGALDAAIELGLPHGGWCPLGRRSEDGPIAAHYCLRETDSPDYPDRTERNVREGDATLILCQGPHAMQNRAWWSICSRVTRGGVSLAGSMNRKCER
jgi:hypothetical protein